MVESVGNRTHDLNDANVAPPTYFANQIRPKHSNLHETLSPSTPPGTPVSPIARNAERKWEKERENNLFSYSYFISPIFSKKVGSFFRYLIFIFCGTIGFLSSNQDCKIGPFIGLPSPFIAVLSCTLY